MSRFIAYLTAMGWEHDRFTAISTDCGHEGVVIVSSDDWGRSAGRYEGFACIDAPVDATGRKRADAREASPQCRGGSCSVLRGERLS